MNKIKARLINFRVLNLLNWAHKLLLKENENKKVLAMVI